MRKRQFGFKQDYLVVVGKVEEQGVLIRALTVVSEGKLINNTLVLDSTRNNAITDTNCCKHSIVDAGCGHHFCYDEFFILLSRIMVKHVARFGHLFYTLLIFKLLCAASYDIIMVPRY